MSYADYQFYTETFFGTAIGEDDFPRLSLRASDWLDYIIRHKDPTGLEDEMAKACCAIAEAMQADEQAGALAAQSASAALQSGAGEIKSESVGGYSVSYATSAEYASLNSPAEASKRYRAIALRYLADTGLLYRGGRC